MQTNTVNVEETLSILNNELGRKSPKTRQYYRCIAKRFLEESCDYSRAGMLKWLDSYGCDNSIRTVYWILLRLCKAVGKPFPLDTDVLPPPVDEDDIHTPIMSTGDINKLITYWKDYAGEYITALIFLSTIYGFRSIEMTTLNLDVEHDSITVNVAKRHRAVLRTHLIPPGMEVYLVGYQQSSEQTVRTAFAYACRRAGIKREKGKNWHSIRRAVDTACLNNGIPELLIKRFMRWAKNRTNMTTVYWHLDFTEANKVMFGMIPLPDIDPPKFIKHPYLKYWE